MISETLGDVIRRLGRLSGLQGDLALTDAQLLERFARQRDESAFAAIMVRHGPMVLGVCRRLLHDSQEAEDAFQAVFLVLARKAGGVQRQALVGPWLYGVAWRVAVRLRGRAARRHRRERVGVDLDALPADDAAWSDVRWVVHEEVQRLPDVYRSAIILCCLEGKTNEEAARLLRRPVGTVKSRLNRGREMLRARLTRRGLALSGAAAGTALAATTAPASPALVDATVRAALPFSAGGAAVSGVVSARAVALSQGVMRTMILTKIKVAAALLLAVALFGGAGGLAYHSWAAAPEDAPKRAAGADKPPAADPPAEADAEKIQGTWVAVSAEMDGKPAPAEAIKNLSIRITADKINFNPNGENRQSLYKLEPAKTPKGIELTPLDGPAKGKMVHCLYELDGDRLKLCLLNGPGEEPKALATTPGSNLRLLILKRKPVDDKPADKPKGDKEALQGAWRVTTVEMEGKDQDDAAAKRAKVGKWVFTADKLTMGAPERRAAYKLDPTKQPKVLDVIPAYPPGEINEGVIPALYELDGDVLKICLGPTPSQIKQRDQALGRRPRPLGIGDLIAPVEMRRPKELATKAGGYSTLLTLKREPAEEEKPKNDTPKDLTAEIVAPAEVASTDPELKGKLVLTNKGDAAVRICTLCSGNDGLGGPFSFHCRPDWWKSDSPSLEASAKAVLALEPGKSYSFPFPIRSIHFQDRDTFRITAFYSVSDETFAKKLDLWLGKAEAAPLLVKVSRK